MQENVYDAKSVTVSESTTVTFMNRVYGWMTFAMLLTGATAYSIYAIPALTNAILMNPFVMFALIILQFGLVIYFSLRLKSMSFGSALGVFSLYSILNGAMLSSIFLLYTTGSIAYTFLITAGLFLVMATIGFVTKRDLTKMGGLLLMALLGIIIASLVNLFLGSSMLDMVITYVAILVFIGLIAYDTNRLKQMSAMIQDPNSPMAKKLSLHGALALYLDFINLFVYLLRIFGKRN